MVLKGNTELKITSALCEDKIHFVWHLATGFGYLFQDKQDLWFSQLKFPVLLHPSLGIKIKMQWAGLQNKIETLN